MDLIIELIVWLFKAIAGDEKSRKAKGAPPSSTQRGPYDYGDNRPATGRPKTLEEILEEVKRQQAQAKQGGARPSSPPNIPSAPAAAPRPAARDDQAGMTAKQKRRRERRAAERAAAQQFAPAAPTPAAEPVQSPIETRTLRSKMEARDIATSERERTYDKTAETADILARGILHSRTVSEVQGVNTMVEIQTIGAMEGGLADKKVNVYNELFKTLRAAPAPARLEMARRAFVFAEVFGPPRSRRPLRQR